MPYPPAPDEGQPGLVQLPDGRYGYRYEGTDDVIIMKQAEPGQAVSETDEA